MAGMHVVVVGAGRLARLLVRAFPDDVAVGVVARRPLPTGFPQRGLAVAPEACAGAAAVFLAVPAASLEEAITGVVAYLSPHAVVVNVATEAGTAELARAWPSLRFVAAKFVGQATEMDRGGRGVVVMDHAEGDDAALVERLLEGVATVVHGDESTVLKVNRAVAEVMARAVSEARNQLAEFGVPDVLTTAALVTMAPGVVRALASDTEGPFLRDVTASIRRVEPPD